MKLTDRPSKIVLPFSYSGDKETIPVASQIGITDGRASYIDGFPPLTRTPISSGGHPPFGTDMNGILHAITSISRWMNASAGLPYDSTFATDSNVSGYPKGAKVLMSDGLGYWLNTVDDNTTDPESSGVGWVPEFAPGVTAITMTSSSVTLTAAQYGKPIISLTGALTSNLYLYLPNSIPGCWMISDKTTGAYSVIVRTVSGGDNVPLTTISTLVFSDGTNVYGPVNEHAALTSPHFATSTPTASRIAMYDSALRLKSGAAPSAANDVVRLTDFAGLIANIGIGAVGSYAFLHHVTANTAITWGGSYSGSSLLPAMIEYDAGTVKVVSYGSVTPSGTWMAMSAASAQAGLYPATLFLRIA
jgi:hypothetical protein